MLQRYTTIVLLILSLSTYDANGEDASIKPIAAYGEAFHMEVSPDGRWAATFENGIIHSDELFVQYLPIRVYDLETGEDALVLNGMTTYATDIAFSPDSALLAAYVPTGYLYVWSLDGGALVKTIPVVPFSGDIEFVRGGSAVAIVQSQPPIVQVWDLESEAMTDLLMNRYTTLTEMQDAFSDGPPDSYSRAVALPDGNTLFVVTFYDNMDAWNLDTQESERVVMSEETLPMLSIRTLVPTPDGQAIVYLHQRGETLNVLDTFTHARREFPAPDAVSAALAVSPDSSTAAWLSVTEDQTELVLTSLESGTEERIPLTGFPEDFRLNTPLTSLAFLPDSEGVVLSGTQLGNPENALYVVRW